MTSLPVASRARARAAASKAVSVPIRSIRSASRISSSCGVARAAILASTGTRKPARYNRAVSQFYDLDEANSRLPEVRDVLAVLRDQRAELIRLRDRTREPDVDE